MLAFIAFLSQQGHAAVIDLDIGFKLGTAESALTVTRVDLTDGNDIRLSQVVGRVQYDLELMITNPTDDVVNIEAVVRRADTDEIISRPFLSTRLGTQAQLFVESSAHKRLALTVLPTLSADAP